ncbi:heme exporter protein CcmD [Legionella cardiaca]|uniref:Heme exporter protein D n=1 Tax=Legionella cardiaca TaxID=1071983 RepID=A0ABY8AMV3_9GAMM|nr:heme exporter protein CcmD [Legionella cardiaca]WED41789.1 heme exporter protein CcmD [Legionella cardiaca]
MSQFMHWWSMGGYSMYVWPAYGLVCIVLGIHVFGIRSQRLRTITKLQQWFKR